MLSLYPLLQGDTECGETVRHPGPHDLPDQVQLPLQLSSSRDSQSGGGETRLQVENCRHRVVTVHSVQAAHSHGRQEDVSLVQHVSGGEDGIVVVIHRYLVHVLPSQADEHQEYRQPHHGPQPRLFLASIVNPRNGGLLGEVQ